MTSASSLPPVANDQDCPAARRRAWKLMVSQPACSDVTATITPGSSVSPGCTMRLVASYWRIVSSSRAHRDNHGHPGTCQNLGRYQTWLVEPECPHGVRLAPQLWRLDARRPQVVQHY